MNPIDSFRRALGSDVRTTSRKHDVKIGPQVLGATPRTCSHWLVIEHTTASRSETILVRIGFVH